MNEKLEMVIEAYLDRISAELQSLPPEMQAETREELRQHLELLIESRREPQQVVQSALRQFGDPAAIGKRIAQEWEEGVWSLNGLSLSQRLEKIREAVVLESELRQRPTPALQAVPWIQGGLLLVLTAIFGMKMEPVLGLSFSDAALSLMSRAVLWLYLAVGFAGCVLVWREKCADGATPNATRVWADILARGTVSASVPAMLLAKSVNQTMVFWGMLMVLNVVIAAMWSSDSSPRRRIVAGSSATYGLVIGVIIVIAIQSTYRLFGGNNWVWLVMIPLFGYFGFWFWKRPQAMFGVSPSNKNLKFQLVGCALLVALAVSNGFSIIRSQQKTKNPQTPMELVESWKWNGAFLAGHTDTAFMKAHMPAALEALRHGLKHPDLHVRMETANTISGLGPQAVPLLPDLKDSLTQEDRHLARMYLAMTFGAIGDKSAATLNFLKSAFASETDEQVKTYLAGSLVQLTAPKFDPLAWQWLMDSLLPPDGHVSKLANWLLTSDSFWDRRWAAAYVLQNMGAAAKPALPALKRLGDDPATTSRVKGKVEEAIQAIQ